MAKIGDTRISPVTGVLYSKESDSVESAATAGAAAANAYVTSVRGDNLGDGVGIFAGSNGSKKVTLDFRSLKAGSGISLTGDAHSIVVTSTGVVTTDLSLMDGLLMVDQGGTGLTTLPVNRIMLGNGLSPMDAIPLPTDTDAMLSWNGTSYEWILLPEVTANVTSVGLTAGSNRLSVVGSTITTSGTFIVDVNEGNLNLNNMGSTLSVTKGGTGAVTLPAGRILIGNGTGGLQSVVAPTNPNTVLSWNGSSYAWAGATTASVTSVGASGANGITVTGGPITTSGSFTISLAATGITPGVYNNPSMTVDPQGRITAISSTTIPVVSGVNIAAGNTVYAGKVGDNLTFKQLVGTNGANISQTASTVTIDVSNLSVAQGGTGATTFTTNGIIYFDGTNLHSVTAPTTGVRFLSHDTNGFAWNTVAQKDTSIIVAGGGGGPLSVTQTSTSTENQFSFSFNPANQSINNFSGTLAVTKGGTGATTLPVNSVLLGNGTGAVGAVAAPSTVASGYVLSYDGTTITWQPITPDGVQGITAGTGLGIVADSTSEGGTISTNGTLYLTDTVGAAGAGAYGVIGGTIDRKGRITAVSDKQSFLLARANHTGTQSVSTLTPGQSPVHTSAFDFNGPIQATVITGTDINVTTLSTVAKSGSYNDLLNKPTMFSGSFADLTSKPTTLLGYGLTDAQALNGNLTAIASTTQGYRKLLVGKSGGGYETLALPSGQHVHVNKAGDDSTANGTALYPFQTVQAAIDSITDASLTKPYSLIIAPGRYEEDTLGLKPWVSLFGYGLDATRIKVTGGTQKVTLEGPEWEDYVGSKRLTISGIYFTEETGFEWDFTQFSNVTGGAVINVLNTLIHGVSEFSGRASSTGGEKDDYVQCNGVTFYKACMLNNVSGLITFSKLYGAVTYNNGLDGTVSYDIVNNFMTNNLTVNSSGSGSTRHLVVNLFGNHLTGTITATGAETELRIDAVSLSSVPTLSGGAVANYITTGEFIQGAHSPVNYSSGTVTAADTIEKHLQAIDITLGVLGAGGGGPGSGTVTSVGLQSNNSLITVSSMPITSSGFLEITFNESSIQLVNTSGSLSSTRITGLAAVATTGDYADLTNKPTLTTGTVTSVGLTAGSSKVTVTGGPVTTSGSITVDVAESALTLGNLGGTLPATKGGTGLSTITAKGLLVGDALNTVTQIGAPTTDGHVLTYSAGALIWAAPNTGSVGEVNTGSNVGSSGAGVYKEKIGSDLHFRKIVAGTGMAVTENADTITVAATVASGPAGSTAPGYYQFTATMNAGNALNDGATPGDIGLSGVPAGWSFVCASGILTVTHTVGRPPINIMMAVSTSDTGGVFKMRAASDGATAGSFNLPSSGSTALNTTDFNITLGGASISSVANGTVHVFVTF